MATGAGGGVGVGGQNLGNLFYQIQQLQQEVMRLNGKVEEQANELRKVKEQSLERYVDLDKRLSGAVTTTAAATPSASTAPSGATEILPGCLCPGARSAVQRRHYRVPDVFA